jgi:hypothetical protein
LDLKELIRACRAAINNEVIYQNKKIYIKTKTVEIKNAIIISYSCITRGC